MLSSDDYLQLLQLNMWLKLSVYEGGNKSIFSYVGLALSKSELKSSHVTETMSEFIVFPRCVCEEFVSTLKDATDLQCVTVRNVNNSCHRYKLWRCAGQHSHRFTEETP